MKFGSKNVFDKIYSTSFWGKGSGEGSDLKQCKPYIDILEKLFCKLGIKTIVDLGCGDWQFTKSINLKGIEYVGIDVVKKVIEENNRLYSSKNITFKLLGEYKDIPISDLLICKDVMQHLSIHENHKIIKEVFPKFKYILSTNGVSPRSQFGDFLYKITGKYSTKSINRNILNGDCTLFNITKYPYKIKAKKILRFKGERYKLKDLARNPSLLLTGNFNKFVKETYLITN